ncbi:MAG TPA: glycosyl hydrolase 108 family protein [Mesorhizobium sp.]|jgi:lysozyme family protein|uniref:glycoside hydrolase family 108 protein n=1 Tax=Mesorhizobium sp. TaxID=1871066 RepID=UPI002DDCADF1|nr:glycosyl hydrolase 108 family protein [Mesorhizobium sp.]HEV2501624.1 glycosyl hydrolase 108 family protein [Mesorhizobium sp.]
MRENFNASLKVTLAYEGGWSDHPKDPGGATMKGITLATYRRYFPSATKLQLRNISADNVAKIYRQDYWQAVNGDSLEAGVDLATFDASVNSGVGRARSWLKASVGGPAHQTVKRLCAKRLGFVQSLKIWKTFGRGWGKRIAAIEAKGVAWALAASAPAATVKAKLADEQQAATKSAKTAQTSGGTAGAATAGGGGDVLVNPHHADQLAGWLIGGLLAVGAIVAIMLITRSIVHRQRAAAYAAEAEGLGVI